MLQFHSGYFREAKKVEIRFLFKFETPSTIFPGINLELKVCIENKKNGQMVGK